MVLLFFALIWGLFLGTIVGSTSIGTGLIGTPALIILFGLEPTIAVGTMSIAGAAMMLTSSFRHGRKGYIQGKILIPFLSGAFPVAFFTGKFANTINQYVPIKNITAGLIIFSTLFLLIRILGKHKKEAEFQIKTKHKVLALPIGIVTGFFMGATSISGSLILLSFLFLLKMPERLAVASASICAALTLGMSSIAHFSSQHYNLIVLLGLLPGTMLGSYIGAHLSHKLPLKAIRLGLIAILLAAGIGLMISSPQGENIMQSMGGPENHSKLTLNTSGFLT